MDTIEIKDNLSITDKNSKIPIENKSLISEELIFQDAIPLSKEKKETITINEEDIFKDSKPLEVEEGYNFYNDLKKLEEEQELKNKELGLKSKDTELIFTNTEQMSEPSAWEKLQYGWAKNDMVFGNILRIGENIWESAFNDEKTFKEAAIENAQIEQQEFEETYAKFLSGKYDGAYSGIGEALTYVLDPYYLMGYTLGSKALANPMSSAILNAALLGGDTLIEQLAKEGEITSWGEIATSAGIGGGIGLVFPYGGKLLKKYLPSGLKDKASTISKFIDDKIAKKNNLTSSELSLVRSVAQKEPVKQITKQIDSLITSPGFKAKGSNFVAPINNARTKYVNLRFKLAKEIKDIKELKKLTSKTKWGSEVAKKEALKSQGKKLTDLRIQGKLAKEAWKKEKERLTKRQVERINKYYKLEGDRTAAILSQLTNNYNVGEKVLVSILANLTKPLFGALGGGAANIGFALMGGDVEDDLGAWMAAGAVFGYSLKAVSKSINIPLAQKDSYGRVIKNIGTRFALQKVREITAGTLSTKLNSFGGTTQKIGRLLLRQIDDSMSSKSVIANADAMERYLLRKASDILKNSTPEEQLAAITINRGNQIAKNSASPKVLKLASDLKSWMDEINLLASNVGFKSSQKIDDYFPRVLNFDEINKDYDKAHRIFTSIFKNNYKLTDDKAKKAATSYLEAGAGESGSVINAAAWNKIISGMEVGVVKNFPGASDDLILTPMSEHLVQKRVLQGPYEIVEKVLEKNNYLVNDLQEILPKIVQDSVKSIAFARTFGKNGQLLKPLLQEIKNKYDDIGKPELLNVGGKRFTALNEARNETKLVLDAVDAYFGRYTGMGSAGQLKNTVGLLTMLSNLNMLGRVTIASLGDLVQIFQHSSNFSAALKGMARTNIRGKWEKGLAKELNYDITNELAKSVQRTAASNEEQMLLNNKWIGNWGVKDTLNANFYNNLAFKAFGLEWLTGYARRFAYNAATFDAFTLSRNFYKVVNGAKGAESKQAIKLQKDLLERYGIKSSEALNIGQYKNLKTAIKNKNANLKLNDAGIRGANRDALIPQVDNRLLFTQSKTPWIRMLGQFLSWAQAKSASANRVIKRIEDGDATLLIKTLATIPIYSAIQQLREYAKHGYVVSDWNNNKKELLAKSWQLSGNVGWLSDLIFNRFMGPGSQKKGTNYFVFAPALNTATNLLMGGVDWLGGRKEAAKKRWERYVLPIPGWRRLIEKKWFPRTPDANTSFKQGLSTGGRVGYETGDEVILPKEKPKDINMNIKDTAKAAVVAGTVLANGVNAEIPTFAEGVKQKYPSNEAGVIIEEAKKIEQLENEMKKAEENKIIPKQKYKKIPELEQPKKEFLFKMASDVYQTNINNVVPNDILIAMAAHETGWGTSRFYNEGNNYFNTVAEKGEPFIKALKSNQKVSKHDLPSDSINKWLNWVNTKDHYKPVRDTLNKYKEGKATKEDIILSIAATNFAQDKKWADKVIYTLNNRINGKNKEELKSLYDSLFVDK